MKIKMFSNPKVYLQFLFDPGGLYGWAMLRVKCEIEREKAKRKKGKEGESEWEKCATFDVRFVKWKWVLNVTKCYRV